MADRTTSALAPASRIDAHQGLCCGPDALEVALLKADASEIGRFVGALFRYADQGTVVSLRAFPDGQVGPPFAIETHQVGDTLARLIAATECLVDRCARAPDPVVFCPPVATFRPGARGATEADLANGLALSVECDTNPTEARQRLEGVLGPATVVIASGGEWLDPKTGEVQAKLHLHWRLSEPTRCLEDHRRLKQARALAAVLVGADATNKPIVHPIRWPGSWHRKGEPRLARIVAETESEIDLEDALERLQDAGAANMNCPPADPSPVRHESPAARGGPEGAKGTGEERDTSELISAILRAEDYHAPIAALAMRYLMGGMADAQVVQTLRGNMQAVPLAVRDIKDGTLQPGRWQARYDDIPRAVATARTKLGSPQVGEGQSDGCGAGGHGSEHEPWPEPVDFLADDTVTGVPALRPEHLPDALWPFVTDVSARMGVDPAAVALAALVACAGVTHENWRIQPKRHDDTWTEAARIWGAIVGDPSILKTPVIAACTKPIERLEAEARRRHADVTSRHKAQAKALKESGGDPASLGPEPRCERFLVEGTTVEALSEVLRDDAEAKHRVPCGKVLVRQDEMSEWIASFDRYRSGGRGGSDRGAYLRLYNGGRYVVDRVGRGSFAVPSWSACVLGGIQPGPIQRIAQEAADDGLLQRFLYCVPAHQHAGLDRAPDRAAMTRYEGLITALAGCQPGTTRDSMGADVKGEEHRPALTLDATAHAHRDAVDALARTVAALPDTSARLKAALGKWPGHFARLCLLFHLVDAADPKAGRTALGQPPAPVVPEATARRVAALMREVLLPHLLRAEAVMFSTAQTGHARWIAGHILAKGQLRIALRDVVQSYRALRAPEQRRQLHDVMDSLVAMAWLRPAADTHLGRPPTAWDVNPAVLTNFAVRAERERVERKAARETITGELRRRAE